MALICIAFSANCASTGSDQLAAIVPKYFPVEIVREIEIEKILYFLLSGVNQIGKIRAVEDSVFVSLEPIVTKIECIGHMRHKRIGRVQVKSRMMIQELKKSFEFQAPHVRDVGGQIRKAIKDLFEVCNAHKGTSSNGARTDMQQDPLFPFNNHFVERKQSTVTGGQLLHNTLKFESQNFRMIKEPLCHDEGIVIVRVIGSKTAQIWNLFKEPNVPVVQSSRNPFSVSIIGIDDWPDTPLSQVSDRFSIVELVQDLYIQMFFKIAPNRIEKPIGKKMHMEINNPIGKHRRRTLLKYHLLIDPSSPWLLPGT